MRNQLFPWKRDSASANYCIELFFAALCDWFSKRHKIPLLRQISFSPLSNFAPNLKQVEELNPPSGNSAKLGTPLKRMKYKHSKHETDKCWYFLGVVSAAFCRNQMIVVLYDKWRNTVGKSAIVSRHKANEIKQLALESVELLEFVATGGRVKFLSAV